MLQFVNHVYMFVTMVTLISKKVFLIYTLVQAFKFSRKNKMSLF